LHYFPFLLKIYPDSSGKNKEIKLKKAKKYPPLVSKKELELFLERLKTIFGSLSLSLSLSAVS
jgi:hypothetical protein